MIDLEGYKSGLDRGAPAWKEALWRLVKIPFFLFPAPLPSRLRAAILAAFGAKIGSGTVIRSGVDISFPWRFSCGDHVWLGEGAKFLTLAEICLGSHVCVSQDAFLCTGSHDFRSPQFPLIARPIRVGDGCWIAARAFVGPGATIGEGSLLAACSVAIKDVPPGHMVTGNPGKIGPLSVAGM